MAKRFEIPDEPPFKPSDWIMHAVLDEDGNVIPVTFMQWAVWFEHNKQRFIQQDHLWGFMVSTVFLGLNHEYLNGPPLWFETMVFDRWHGDYNFISDRPQDHVDIYVMRYTTLKEALAGHAEALAWLKAQPFCYQLCLPSH